jgi:hypothetical protein
MVMSQSMWTGPRVTRDFRCGGIAGFAHDYLCGQLHIRLAVSSLAFFMFNRCTTLLLFLSIG